MCIQDYARTFLQVAHPKAMRRDGNNAPNEQGDQKAQTNKLGLVWLR